MEYYIYTLSNPSTGDIFYVGCTNDLMRRIRGHRYNYLRHKEKTGINLSGKDLYILALGTNPVIHLIEEFLADTRTLSLQREAFWIRLMISNGFPLVNDRLNFSSGINDVPPVSFSPKLVLPHHEWKRSKTAA